MSDRAKKGRGRRALGTARGPGSNVARGKSGRGTAGPSFPLFTGCGRALRPQHAKVVVDWISRDSSSSSSTVTQAEASVQSPAISIVDTASAMSTSIPPAIASTSGMAQESAELFDHSVSHLFMDDAQPLVDSDVGSEVGQDYNNMRVETEPNNGWQIASKIPRAAAYCNVLSSGNEDDDEGTDATWVPDREEEGTEGEESEAGGQQEVRVASTHPTPSAVVLSQPVSSTSACWFFF